MGCTWAAQGLPSGYPWACSSAFPHGQPMGTSVPVGRPWVPFGQAMGTTGCPWAVHVAKLYRAHVAKPCAGDLDFRTLFFRADIIIGDLQETHSRVEGYRRTFVRKSCTGLFVVMVSTLATSIVYRPSKSSVTFNPRYTKAPVLRQQSPRPLYASRDWLTCRMPCALSFLLSVLVCVAASTQARRLHSVYQMRWGLQVS